MASLFRHYLGPEHALRTGEQATVQYPQPPGPRRELPAAEAGDHRYCIISPCRDEVAYVQRTLDSVIAQTVRPALWLIVDDGSTDGTAEILRRYAARHDFIRIVLRSDRGRRAVGPGVIEAFYAGYATIHPTDFDYICKLDMDLDLPPGYFEALLQQMDDDPRLGCCSGRAWYRHPQTGAVTLEQISWEMSVGASKFYRRDCLEQIGGLDREVMWDGIDCHRCRMLGWRAGSFDGPNLRFEHLRPMGSSEGGLLRGRMRHGLGQYYMGTGLAYITASALFRLGCRPRLLGSVAIWWGYVASALRRRRRLDDPAFRRFLRRYQWLCLTRGKKRATEIICQEQAHRWDPTVAGATASVDTAP